MKSGIITRGYGYRRSTIITRGYGDIIDIIEEVISTTLNRRVGGSSYTKRKLERDVEELCVKVSLLELNGNIDTKEITNSLCKKFANTQLSVTIDDVEVITQGADIIVKAKLTDNKTIRNITKVSATIKDN